MSKDCCPKISSFNHVSLKQAFSFALIAVAIYHASVIAYITMQLSNASAYGEFGSVIARVEEMYEIFPFHTHWFTQMVLIPLPNRKAISYYENQREFFEEAARNFEIHPYFINDDVHEGMTFRGVVSERIKGMYRRFEEDGRMDYKLEKDRCAMFEFFARNNIKHPKVRKMWYSREDAISEVTDGSVSDATKVWPIFFKACHLTQRSSGGTFAVSSPSDYEEKKESLVSFVNDKWEYRSRDVGRPWQKEGDAITDALTPSFLVQEPMEQSASAEKYEIQGRMSVGLIEIRAEVLWGKVYLMILDGSTVFLRNGEIEDYTGIMGGVLKMPPAGGERVSWVRDEGYLDCATKTAELIANIAHVEYVRVDIWLNKGDPDACQVNEISLSSGYAYFGHDKQMAKLWAKPLRTKSYKIFNSSKPVHLLTRKDSNL